ncbi:queuosine-tRNA galactosyltransferase isoform X2 [Vulpes vulpes]|uniref:Queuosine-tRNA galactosyltransferase isoform X2 n=1 Tax=Vulpes vulpes TaxID=9627 RepID=A0ABM4ZFT5_VULVU
MRIISHRNLELRGFSPPNKTELVVPRLILASSGPQRLPGSTDAWDTAEPGDKVKRESGETRDSWDLSPQAPARNVEPGELGGPCTPPARRWGATGRSRPESRRRDLVSAEASSPERPGWALRLPAVPSAASSVGEVSLSAAAGVFTVSAPSGCGPRGLKPYHREREREAETQAEGEAGSMHREPDVGFDPGSPGSRPGPKAGAKPLRHPGIPAFHVGSVSLVSMRSSVFTSHGPTVVMPTWFCSRTWFSHVGPFDEGGQGVPEDLLLFYNHLRKGGGVVRVDRSLVLYRYHPDAATHSVLDLSAASWFGAGLGVVCAVGSGSRPGGGCGRVRVSHGVWARPELHGRGQTDPTWEGPRGRPGAARHPGPRVWPTCLRDASWCETNQLRVRFQGLESSTVCFLTTWD